MLIKTHTNIIASPITPIIKLISINFSTLEIIRANERVDISNLVGRERIVITIYHITILLGWKFLYQMICLSV